MSVLRSDVHGVMLVTGVKILHAAGNGMLRVLHVEADRAARGMAEESSAGKLSKIGAVFGAVDKSGMKRDKAMAFGYVSGKILRHHFGNTLFKPRLMIAQIEAVAFAADDENSAYTPPNINYTIVVDPGHGGADPGSIGYKTKVKESDLNLKLSLMLADKLRTVGIKVIMTRTDNNSLAQGSGKGFKKQDMKLRKEMINKIRPNMVVSVHMNSYTCISMKSAAFMGHMEI